MQQFIIIFLIFLQISDLTWAKENTAEPYCYRNRTEVSYITVTKTRTKTVPKKSFLGKLGLKKETQKEEFLVEEPVHKTILESACCDGYKMSDLKLCEPQCVKNGCPEHSKCIEPEVCECVKGYFSARSPHDGKHYCEPICEQVCTEHSVCVAPNKCECTEGYKSEHDSCLPICSLGDQCRHGKCVATETCKCNYGYILNSISHTCEPNLDNIKANQDYEYIESSSINYEEIMESTYQPESSVELGTDIDTSKDDMDSTEVFDEFVDSTTYSSTQDDLPSANSHNCPDDYVYHQGQCKPLKFASLELDCRFKPCNDPHAICIDNGTCTCTEGFKWFKTYQKADLENPIKSICLSLADYEAGLKQLQQDDPGKSEVKDPFNWAIIFFTVLGALIFLIALVFLGLKLVWMQRGELDVEGKNLSCAYNNQACVDSEKSAI